MAFEVLNEPLHDRIPTVPPLYDDASEDDTEPLRIKRHVASSSEKLLGIALEEDFRPLQKLRHCGAHVGASPEKSRCKALLLRMRRRGAFSSKKSHGKDSSLKKQCHSATSSENSCGKGKGKDIGPENGEAQTPLEMQHHGAFSPENSSAKGSHTSTMKEECLSPGLTDSDDEVWKYASDDEDLIYNCVGWISPHVASEPEMYRITMGAPGEKSDFVDKLEEIGCGSRFVACSVESTSVFFAKLNTEEAVKLGGLKGIAFLMAYRDSVVHY